MLENLPALLEVLERGGVVACPTETFVGLLADATNPEAVERVAELKGRPAEAPIAVLLPAVSAVDQVATPLPEVADELARTHWPGPLTIVAKAKGGLSPWLVHEGKVGMRVPGPSPARELVVAFGRPLTATSANVTGEPPVESVEALASELRERVDAEVAGIAPGGLPSTVVDVTATPFRVLRQGATRLARAGA